MSTRPVTLCLFASLYRSADAPMQPPLSPGPAQVLDCAQRLRGLAVADVEATVLAARIDGQRDAGLGHHSDPASARRDVVSQVLACAGTDQHRVEIGRAHV